MSAYDNRLNNRFSVTTSRFLLPTFRRPCYTDIIKMNQNFESIDKSDLFYQWTLEGQLSLYKTINEALLSDNFDVLQENMIYINKLRYAIEQNNLDTSLKVYRNLKLDPIYVRDEYKENQIFLWPTFSSTSRNKDIASKFGNYTFEIDALANDFTYRTDISQYSRYPHEEEILFYPYSGFRIKNILSDARIIQLECFDTLDIEAYSKALIPNQVKLFDQTHEPDKLYIIGENTNGYWDSHYRYHHKNGYFVHKGNFLWEEYQNNQYYASFQQV